MKILYLAHRLPFPPDKGCRTRAFHFIRHLSRRHRVWCAAFCEGPRHAQELSGLQPYCEEVMALALRPRRRWLRGGASWLCGRSLTEGVYGDRRLHDHLRRWHADVRFDAAIAFSGCMAQYLWPLGGTRRIVDLCDVDSLKWAEYAKKATVPPALIYQIEASRVRQLEQSVVAKADATLVITQQEADLLRTKAPFADRIHVVGNGVEIPERIAPVEATRPIVGFVGDMSYPPNDGAVRRFVATTWPLIRREAPQAEFWIIGRNPSRAVQCLHGNEGVRVTGAIAQVSPFIDQLRVSVAPLVIARGLQNKVLEAMAHGRPVVASAQAAAGLDRNNDCPLRVATAPTATMREITPFLRDPLLAARVGCASRAWAAARYRWDDRLKDLDAVLARMIDPSYRGVVEPGCCEPAAALAFGPN